MTPCTYHRNDRFPRSTQEPDSRSPHLYAGRRPGSKQVSPELSPEYRRASGFDVTLSFRHLISCSLALASFIIYLTSSCEAFSLTLTTLALYQRSLRWFEASTCMAASRDLPSSLVQHRTLEYKTLWCVRGTLLASNLHSLLSPHVSFPTSCAKVLLDLIPN